MMRIDTLENLVLEDVQDIRSVEQQVMKSVIDMTRGATPQGLWQGLMQLVEKTELLMKRLEAAVSQARERQPADFERLTSREAEVLQLIAEGYANKQIAAELAISVKTVEKHRQRMMAKLDLHDTAGVTRYAISAGVVQAGA
jgi:DNA-binding NarL/FixJ family response regulator